MQNKIKIFHHFEVKIMILYPISPQFFELTPCLRLCQIKLKMLHYFEGTKLRQQRISET